MSSTQRSSSTSRSKLPRGRLQHGLTGSPTRLAELSGPVEAALPRINVPAFIGWGDQDAFFELAQGERTAAAMGVELRVYEGAGHFVPHERPDEVATDVIALAARSSQA